MTIYLTERHHCLDVATSGDQGELHEFAEKMGFIRGQFRGGRLARYDFSFERKEEAIEAGAILVSQAEQFSLCWAKFYRKRVHKISLAWYHEPYRAWSDELGVRVRFGRTNHYTKDRYNPTKSSMRRLLELAWKYEFRTLKTLKDQRLIIQPYREGDS